MTVHLPAAAAWIIVIGFIIHWAIDAALAVLKYRLERQADGKKANT